MVHGEHHHTQATPCERCVQALIAEEQTLLAGLSPEMHHAMQHLLSTIAVSLTSYSNIACMPAAVSQGH